jgi:hypothetical protein
LFTTTAAGFACPLLTLIACPTKNPSTLAFGFILLDLLGIPRDHFVDDHPECARGAPKQQFRSRVELYVDF